MTSYTIMIEELLIGETPKEKYEWLKNLVSENARAKGRLDFCKRQFEIIQKNIDTDPYTKGYVGSILKTFNTEL